MKRHTHREYEQHVRERRDGPTDWAVVVDDRDGRRKKEVWKKWKNGGPARCKKKRLDKQTPAKRVTIVSVSCTDANTFLSP